jgi:epoxyqueuosine reductase QueG
MANKRCGKCKTRKSISLFSKNRRREDGLQDQCKECMQVHSARNNPINNPKNADYRWERILQRKYGITAEDYSYMLEQQQGGCAICFQSTPSGRRLAVDHNHDTGEVRGLLCGSCNIGLGNFGDNVDNLEAAIDYLNYTSNYRKQT